MDIIETAKAANKHASWISDWWGVATVCGVIWAAMTPLFAHFEPAVRYGWAGIILFAGAAACIAMFAISSLLMAWRFFYPVNFIQPGGELAPPIANLPPFAGENTAPDAFQIINESTPSSMTLTTLEQFTIHQATQELKTFILSDIEQAYMGWLNVVHYASNVDNGRPNRHVVLSAFMIKGVDSVMRRAWSNLASVAMDEGAEIQNFGAPLLDFFREYRDFQQIIKQFGEEVGIDLDRDSLLTRWIEADHRCLLTLRKIRTQPLLKNQLEKIPENLFMSLGIEGRYS